MGRAIEPALGSWHRQRGMSLLELLIVVGIIGIIASILLPTYIRALRTSQSRALVAEGRSIFTAMAQYYHDYSAYPAVLDRATLEPLRELSYYRGNVVDRLLDGEADAYDAPSDTGPHQEFFLEMTLQAEPRYRVLVADSDDSTIRPGEWFDGVYLFYDGVRLPL